MVDWRILGAGVVGLAGFDASDSIYGFCDTSVTRAVFVPWGAFLALVLGISAWKLRKEIFGYVMLLATAGIAGAVSRLALIALILD